MDHIMIVEDDFELANQIHKMLMKYNYKVTMIRNYRAVVEEVLSVTPDILLLDINLPYSDGYEICKELKSKVDIPIIFISARASDFEQILGLEIGADDYVVKPFSMEILQAKIKNVLRRIKKVKTSNYSIGRVWIDPKTFHLSDGDSAIELSKVEYKLLTLLLENKNQYISRDFLLREIWDDERFVNDNTLNVNISRIKNKLAEFGLTDIIKTKRGVGYMISDMEDV